MEVPIIWRWGVVMCTSYISFLQGLACDIGMCKLFETPRKINGGPSSGDFGFQDSGVLCHTLLPSKEGFRGRDSKGICCLNWPAILCLEFRWNTVDIQMFQTSLSNRSFRFSRFFPWIWENVFHEDEGTVWIPRFLQARHVKGAFLSLP